MYFVHSVQNSIDRMEMSILSILDKAGFVSSRQKKKNFYPLASLGIKILYAIYFLKESFNMIFVVPTEIVRGYEHIRDTLGEEKAGRFLESVIVYGAYGEEKIDPPELRQAIKLA